MSGSLVQFALPLMS
jgi:alcohol dehydrogenase (cytochrome c)